MKLQLVRPLAVFDLETTGVDVSSDRIVEIAILKIDADGKQSQYVKRVNPLMPIPAESSAIHGIYDKDIADAPTFEQIADEVATFIGDADLAGYNSNKFDIPVLAEEFLRVNHSFDMGARNFVDVQNIFHKMEQRTLVAAYAFYCNKNLENAHSAMADVQATWEVFEAQLERYQDLGKSIEELSKFTQNSSDEWVDFAGRIARNEKGQVVYNFGKHKGKTVREVAKIESGYYGWMMDANFPRYTKLVLKNEMERIKRENEEYKHKKQEQESKKFENKLEQLKNKFN